jgi:hypothetical protein
MSILARIDPAAAELVRLAAENTRLRAACEAAYERLGASDRASGATLDGSVTELLRAALTPPPPLPGPLTRRLAERNAP